MDKISYIKNLVLAWYEQNKRTLPWREDPHPYKIWLSEIILQQTRVAQGLPYFQRFIAAFPTIEHLAKADEESVLKLWQGLGYYSRARNLHHTAIEIHQNRNNQFPVTFTELIKLKGVGEYTAAAIASIAFHEPVPVIDGNVYRVLSRLFNIDLPIDSSEGKKMFKSLAQELLHTEKPGEYNQAIMEFGALQCVPVNPDCQACPLLELCEAYHNNTIDTRPIKRGKTIVEKRWHYYFVLTDQQHVYIDKRPNKGIWGGMYQFPLEETKTPLAPDQLSELSLWNRLYQPHFDLQIIQNKKKHLLSHRQIHATYILLISKDKLSDTIHPFQLKPTKELSKLPVSKLMDSFLTNYYESIFENRSR